MTEINESPVFLLLNPAIDAARKDLPVTVFETGRLPVQLVGSKSAPV